MHKYQLIPVFIILAVFTLNSCKEEDPETTTTIQGEITSASDCKSFDKSTNEVANDESCVEYTYDTDENILYLTHVNAGFNCCPGDISADISQSGDSIFISEQESEALCDCNCLYDLEIKLEDIKADTYHFKFIEPYAEGQESLVFSINLENSTSGSHCVSRTGYPWGI